MPIIAMIAPKGGVGKTTVAANLLAAARVAGLEATGLDLDEQATLARWAAKREAGGIEPACRVSAAELTGWREALAEERMRALVVVDCPPGTGGGARLAALTALAEAAALVLTPCPPGELELEAVGDLGAIFGSTFVLNMTVRGPELPIAREYLRGRGDLCPVELPSRIDIRRQVAGGGSVADRPSLPGGAEVLALWRWVADRLRLMP